MKEEELKKQIAALKERVALQEKIAKNLELEMKTIDILSQHASTEAAKIGPEHTKATLMIIDDIETIASIYR